ncbi:MAG: hypothetical protein IK092_02375, partial [Muribaculaceae bacterium]|nr:hypothetical protein [Muribaculaceae bacterium]
MKPISIYTITSALHNEQAVNNATQEFLNSLNIDYDFKGKDFGDYGSSKLDLIYIRTGGAEGIFKELLPSLLKQSQQPFYLLTSGKSNSLAASLEILSFLRQNGLKGEVIHGSSQYISKRIADILILNEAKRKLNGSRLGIIGRPSDWLISSNADPDSVLAKLGITLVNIDMEELLTTIKSTPIEAPAEKCDTPAIAKSLPVANQIYMALKTIVEKYNLQGFTLRCFDLLGTIHNTGCYALAKFNSDGIVATCEGDVPAMLSMAIANALTGKPGFQANPAYIDVEKGEMLFAHCTIPFSMIERFEWDTHFESGIGVAIRGYMKEGPITLLKVSGDLSRSFVAQGELIANQAKPDLCRTQQIIRLDNKDDATYFLTNPIGNHHIIVQGHHKSII